MLMNAPAIQATSEGFQLLWTEAFEAATPIHAGLMAEVTSSGSAETYLIPELFGDLRVWVGDRNVQPFLSNPITIDNIDYELTVAVPRNAYLDDQIGMFSGTIRMMGASAKKLPGKLMTDLLTSGFTALCYDGEAFFSAAHPQDGGTQSNLVVLALDADAFTAAFALLEGMQGYYGDPLEIVDMGELVLMVGPSQRSTAEAIVEAELLASGASNLNYGKAELVVNKRLTGDYANYWFLMVRNGPVQPFILQMRKEPEFVVLDDVNNETLFKKKSILHGVDGRLGAGYGFWQLAVGSLGEDP